MKKILLLSLAAVFGLQAYAGHYNKKGTIDTKKYTYTIKDKRVSTSNQLDTKSPYLVFEQEDGDKLLGTNSKINDYIGASGKSHKLSDLFSMYENRAFAVGMDRNFSFTSNHDEDVMVLISKEGNKYSIDIYTGEDARQKKKELNKK